MGTFSEGLSTVRFAAAPLPALVGPLLALKSHAEVRGLLVLDGVLPRIDHPVLRRLLSAVADGLGPVELVISGLEAGAAEVSSEEKTRIVFFTLFGLLLQSGDRDAEALLRRCMDRKAPLRSIAEKLIKDYMPFHWKRLNGRTSELQEVVDRGCSRDAQTLYAGGLVALGLDELDNSVEILEWFRSEFLRLHPFLWAFQDYLETSEVETAGGAGLLGALRFGFLSQADMPGAFKTLSSLRASGRAGPFTSFLLGMLFLYHEESVPYDPGKAYTLFSEAAKLGSPLGAEWQAKFLGCKETPAFPGGAVPRSVSGGEVLSADEVRQLVSVFSFPEDRDSKPCPVWLDPAKVPEVLLRQAPGWSGPCLKAQAIQAATRGDAAKAWDYVRSGAVLGETWAVETVVGAWAGAPEGILPNDAEARAALGQAIRADRRSRPLLVPAVRSQACRGALECLTARLEERREVPPDRSLAARLRLEMESLDRSQKAAGGLSQAEIDQLLNG